MLPDTTSRFFSVGSVKLHYREYGSGPALIFCHGFPDNELTFTEQFKLFSRDYRVILPTLRGYPPSDVPPQEESYDAETMAGDFLALLDHLAIDKAVFAGGDVGGILIQKLACMHPERFLGLVLFNTPILGNVPHLLKHDKEQQRLAERLLPYMDHNPGDDYDVLSVVETIADPAHRADIARYLKNSPVEGMFYFFRRNFSRPPYQDDVDTSGIHYKMPSLVIWGMRDPYFSQRMLDGFYKWFERPVRVVALPEAGHWVWRDDATRVNRELRWWLTALQEGHL